MAREYFIAEDGTIHNEPALLANDDMSNAYSRSSAISTGHSQTRSEYMSRDHISHGRIACFWMISCFITALIAFITTRTVGPTVYGNDQGFFATIGPYIVFIGAFAGSILYGIFCAKSGEYNLWAYILSALSSIGGIIAAGIAVAVISLVAVVLFYVFIIALVIAIICAIVGGS